MLMKRIYIKKTHSFLFYNNNNNKSINFSIFEILNLKNAFIINEKKKKKKKQTNY